jgi:hypothetical protein
MQVLRKTFLPLSLAAAAAIAAVPGAGAAERIVDVSLTAALPDPGAAGAALYSFADVYRLTVAGAALEPMPSHLGVPLRALDLSGPARQARTAAVSVPAAEAGVQAAYVFSIDRVPEPGRWLLVVSGLALAAWVARRRQGYSIPI